MQLPSRFWADLTTRHFAQLSQSSDLDKTVAVLPVAATEQHGPHLPLSVDTTLVDGVIQCALPYLGADLPVLILPTQQIGRSAEHIRFPGTLSLSAATLMAVWTELGACVARTGIRKLVLFNAHGGQVSIMDVVARDLRTAHNMIVYSTNWYSLPLSDAVTGQFSLHEHRFGIHAGDIETSMMLSLLPERVEMALAKDFYSNAQDRAARQPILGNGVTAKLGWQMQDYNPEGAAGNAAAATAAKGKALIEDAGKQLAQLLQEVSTLPLSILRDSVQSYD
jgi:creatinine amidohydrolase